MREIRASHITDTVARLCVEANRQLPQDVRSRICAAFSGWAISRRPMASLLQVATSTQAKEWEPFPQRRTAAADLSGYWHGLRFC